MANPQDIQPQPYAPYDPATATPQDIRPMPVSGLSFGGITMDAVNTAIAAAQSATQALIPVAATATPAAIAVTGAVGVASPYARSDHTHTTSVQRARIAVVGSGGIATWTFATPYDAGVVPSCEATVEAPAGSTSSYNVQLNGAPTNTAASFKVFGPPTVTASVLGVSVGVSFPLAPAGTFIHAQAAKPTQ